MICIPIMPFAKKKLLNYYSELNVEGKISELEMESKMDDLKVMDHHKLISKWKRAQQKLRKQKKQ